MQLYRPLEEVLVRRKVVVDRKSLQIFSEVVTALAAWNHSWQHVEKGSVVHLSGSVEHVWCPKTYKMNGCPCVWTPMVWLDSHCFLYKNKQNCFSVMLKNHTCRNCGGQGHLYKTCTQPITSFGIICYKFRNGEKEPKYLMIQRKDSLCFMEFIRGKYDVSDEAYIKRLLSGMTNYERDMILNQPFQDLWNYIWLQPSIPRLTIEYEAAKVKFQTLGTKLTEYIESTDSPYMESEYGFPKGRRKLKENDITCAVREFHEETGFAETDIHVHMDVPSYEEVFYGTNNVLYRHVYYVARMEKEDSDNPQIDPDNINQLREVRAVKWFNFQDTMEHIREYNTERRDLFQMVHNRILSLV